MNNAVFPICSNIVEKEVNCLFSGVISKCLASSDGTEGFMVGVWVMFGVVSFWIQHPSNIETGLEIRGIEATINAYPSFWPGGRQLFCW